MVYAFQRTTVFQLSIYVRIETFVSFKRDLNDLRPVFFNHYRYPFSTIKLVILS